MLVWTLLAAVNTTLITSFSLLPTGSLTRAVNAPPEFGLCSVLILWPSSENVTDAISFPLTDAR